MSAIHALAARNGTIVPLDHELQSGDMVEIITQKGKRPSEDWLAFIKSGVARDHIRASLRMKKQIAGAGSRTAAVPN